MLYKRNQVEEALWRLKAGRRGSGPPPPVFRTRVKRLLELDRQGMAESERPPRGFAFIDAMPRGKGADIGFTEINAFCLSAGLDLLDTGYKQSEVVYLLQHIRPLLEKAHAAERRNPAVPNLNLLAEDRPGSPVYVENGIEFADTRLFLLLGRVEMREAYPLHDQSLPLIFAPELVRGLTALTETLHNRVRGMSKVHVLELSVMASSLRFRLAETEPRTRGRAA